MELLDELLVELLQGLEVLLEFLERLLRLVGEGLVPGLVDLLHHVLLELLQLRELDPDLLVELRVL